MGDFQGLCLFTGGYPGVDHSPETCGPFLGIPWDPQKSVTVTEFGEVTFFLFIQTYCEWSIGWMNHELSPLNHEWISWLPPCWRNCWVKSMDCEWNFPSDPTLLSHVTFPRRPMSSSSLVANFAAGMPPAFAPWAAASAAHVVAPTSNLKNHP